MRSKYLSRSCRRRLMDMPPEELVTVYTMQLRTCYARMQEVGYLAADFMKSDCYNDPEILPVENSWRIAYDYMYARMKQEIPDFSGDAPIWFWPLYKPHWPEGHFKDNVIIKARVPRKRVVFSLYGMWHAPLNNWPIYDENEGDDDAFIDHLLNTDRQRNWHKVFDIVDGGGPEFMKSHENVKRGAVSVQGCVDRIYFYEVEHVFESAR